MRNRRHVSQIPPMFDYGDYDKLLQTEQVMQLWRTAYSPSAIRARRVALKVAEYWRRKTCRLIYGNPGKAIREFEKIRRFI